MVGRSKNLLRRGYIGGFHSEEVPYTAQPLNISSSSTSRARSVNSSPNNVIWSYIKTVMTRVVEVLVTFAERELYSYSQNNDQDQCRIISVFRSTLFIVLHLNLSCTFQSNLRASNNNVIMFLAISVLLSKSLSTHLFLYFTSFQLNIRVKTLTGN